LYNKYNVPFFDFQEVFDIVYQRARYDLSVKYTALLDPPLTPEELRWVQEGSGLIESR